MLTSLLRSGFSFGGAEKLGDKLCVYNYGHGGAGITLSWGTAQLAADEVVESGQKQVAVSSATSGV